MSSIQQYNQTGPFWDFVAKLEEKGADHPWFKRQRNANRDEAEAEGGRRGPRARLARQLDAQDTEPFWNFIAELQQQGPAHPWFKRQRGGNRGEAGAESGRRGHRARRAAQLEAQDAEMRDPSSETETGDEVAAAAAAAEKTNVRDFQESDGEGLTSGDDGLHALLGRRGGRFAGRGRAMGMGGRGREGMGGRGGRGMGPGHRHHHHHGPRHHMPSDGEEVTGDEGPRGFGGRGGRGGRGWGGRGMGGGKHHGGKHERHHGHGPNAWGHGEVSGDEAGPWARGSRGRHGRDMHRFGPMRAMFPETFGDQDNQKDGTDRKSKDKFRPAVDVFDHAEAFVVHVSLPGAKKEDIEVNWNAERSALQITGHIDRPADEEVLKTIAVQERKVGPFERMVRLGSRANPAQVEVEAISAKVEDGVLRIEVPKTDEGFVEVRKVDIA